MMENKETRIQPEMTLSVVLDRDIYETNEFGTKVLLARRGERVTPEVATKHGVLPIESAGVPAMESKVVRSTSTQQLSAASHKRAF
jgi:hypothetical protein|tara:strand:- start:323 stop:580 length:258 start_codon:yes stop_codon:yes gene_type:complete